MKIAIFPEYGGIYIPSFLAKQILSDYWIHQRVELANIIEQLEPTHHKITQKVYDEYAHSICSELQFYDYIKGNDKPNIIYVKDTESIPSYVYKIEIIDVDTNKIWKLDTYDGAEGIEYYNKPKIRDKELNYAEW